MRNMEIREAKGPWAKLGLAVLTGSLAYVVAACLDQFIPSPSAAVAYGMGCFSGYILSGFDSWEE